jgi:hypothetical protein
MRNLLSHHTLAAVISAPLLAACTQAAPHVAEEVVAEKAELPFCASLTDDILTTLGSANCRLISDDPYGWHADVTYGDEDNGSVTVTLTIKAADNSVGQTITETAERSYGPPAFNDLDSDGRPDLLVPLMTGNVNTSYAVWRDTGEATPFARAGELGGIDVGATGGGMFASTARGSAASWYTSYYVFRSNLLVPIATAQTDLSEDGKETCTVTDDGGLESVGMTLEAAQLKFCEPA